MSAVAAVEPILRLRTLRVWDEKDDKANKQALADVDQFIKQDWFAVSDDCLPHMAVD